MFVVIPGHHLYLINEDGVIHSIRVGRDLNPKALRNGYIKVGLLVSSSPRRYKYYSVHQLVLLAFMGPCPEDMEATHRDGNKLNNHLENLEYKTHKENMQDQRAHGTFWNSKGKRGKLSIEQVNEIKSKRHKSRRELAEEYKVSQRHIERILNGTRRKHG